MENAPSTNAENAVDDDAADVKSEKTSDKRKRQQKVGRIIGAAAESNSDRKAEASEKKARVAKESASIIDKLFGAEESDEAPSRSAAETIDQQANEVEIAETPAEERAVTALAEGGELNLRGVEPERDEAIINLALERAAAETTQETLPVEEQMSIEVASAEDEQNIELSEEDAVPTIEIVPTAETAGPVAPDDQEQLVPAQTLTPAPTPQRSSASGGSNRPPVPPVSAATVSPLLRPMSGAATSFTRTTMYGSLARPNTYQSRVVSSSNAAELAKTVEDAESYAFRRGRNRGLVAGLLLGGGIEHIRHRRREKRMERTFARERKEQEKKVENLRWDHIREAENAKAREAAADTNRTIERSSSLTKPEATLEATAKKLDKERKEIQQAISRAEQIEQERQREQLDISAGHHIERSAWHNIEVDEHGKAAEESSIEYGHEYYKERAQETAPKNQAQKKHFDAVAGEVALVAAALGGSNSSTGAAAGDSSKEKDQKAIPSAAQTTFSVRPSLLKSVTAPPTTTAGTIGWTIALLVILTIFAVVVL